MRLLERCMPSISVLLCVALVANLTNEFGLLNEHSVWAASSPSGDSSQTDVTEVGVTPLASPAQGAIGRAGNLPIGFNNLATFHESLVQKAEGYFRIAYQDIAIPCQGPSLEVHRIYNSAVTRRTAFGRGWSWGWGARLDTDEVTGNPVLIDDNNLKIHFGASGGGYQAINSAMLVTLTRNASGSVLSFVDNSREYFNFSGQLLAIQDPAGRMLNLRYTGTLMTEAVDCYGRKLQFTYEGTHIRTITDPLNRQWKYEYDGDNLTAAVDPMGRRTEYSYLPKFGWGERMSHVRFPNNVEMVIYYHPLSKRVIKIDGPGPTGAKFRYDVNPYDETMREWVTNARGDTSDDLFDGSGLQVQPYQQSGGSGGSSGQEMLYVSSKSFTGPSYMENVDTHHDTAGAPWVTTSDSGTLMSEDPLGNVTRVQKDSLGRVSQTTDALGQETQFSWDSDSGQISSIELPNGGSISMQYQQGQLRSYTDPSGRTWKTDPITSPNPVGPPTSGRRMTDPGGNQTMLEFDEWGNPSKFRDADGGVRTITFDIVGRMLARADAAGNMSHYTYDKADNLITVTDPAGAKVEFAYDAMNHLVRITDSLRKSITITYDARGLLTAMTLSTGEEEKYEYDQVGNLLAIHSPGSRSEVVSRFEYDKDQRPTRATDPLGHVWQSTYDAAGQQTGMISPGGNQTGLLHDPTGRLLSVLRPDGTSLQMTYGPAAQPQTVSYAGSTGSSLLLSYQYDPANRLTSVTSGGQSLEKITYDTVGRAMQFDSPGFSTQNQFDPAGRPLVVLSGAMDHPQTFHYQYDPDGRVTGMTEPAGQQRTYSYKFNRLASVQVQDLGAVQFNRDRLSRVTSIQLPGGVRADYQYDSEGRLISLAYFGAVGNAGPAFEYTYDAHGNLVTSTESGRTVNYQYDADGRLIAAARQGAAAQNFAFDADDNLTQFPGISGQSLKYDAADKLIAVGDSIWNYDARGNLVSKSDGTLYKYDAQGRLTRIDFPDGTYAAYQYDATGNRVQKNVNGVVTNYAYSGGQILAEYDGSWTLRVRYVYAPGIDRPLAMWRDGKWFYFVRDRLGSVRGLLDQTGKTIESYDYDAYGSVAGGAPGKPISRLHPFGFASSQYDAESGLYFMRARYYDPAVGRFIQRDPLESMGGPHPYQYADGNPISVRDPLGLEDDSGGETPGADSDGGGEQDGDWLDTFMVGRMLLEDAVSTHIAHTAQEAEQGFEEAKALWETARWYRTLSTDAQAFSDHLWVETYVAKDADMALRAEAGMVGWANQAEDYACLYEQYAAQSGLAHEEAELIEESLGHAESVIPFTGGNTLAEVLPAANTFMFYWEAYQFFTNPTHEGFRNLELDAALACIFFAISFDAPVFLFFAAAFFLFIGIDALMEMFKLDHADPSFIEPIEPTANAGPLRASPLYLGLAGLADDALPGGRAVRLYDPGGKFLGLLKPGVDPGATAMLPFAAARYALVGADDRPELRTVVVDFDKPKVEVSSVSEDQAGTGRVGVRFKVGGADLRQVAVQAIAPNSTGPGIELARLLPPKTAVTPTIDQYRLPVGGDWNIQVVAIDAAGNRQTGSTTVSLAAPAQRPLALYGLTARTSADVIDPTTLEQSEDAANTTRQELAAADFKPAWLGGDAPDGVTKLGSWSWSTDFAFGAPRSHTGGSSSGPSLHYFIHAKDPFTLEAQSNLVQYVYLDPKAPPKEILLQIYTPGEQGEHRVYWGDNLIDLGGSPGTASLDYVGPLPKPGEWTRLRIPLQKFGLETANATGILFGQSDGLAWWGPTTKSNALVDDSPEMATVSHSAKPADALPYTVSLRAIYQLSTNARTRISVRNASGQIVATPVDELQGAGNHRLLWDCTDKDGKLLPDGKYQLLIEASPTVAGPQPVSATVDFDVNSMVAHIAVPSEGSTVTDTVPIFGTAAGRNFEQYVVDFGPGENPDHWEKVASWGCPTVIGSPPLNLDHSHTVQGNLGSLNAHGLTHAEGQNGYSATIPDGRYTLRLRSMSADGRAAEDRVHVWIGQVASNGGPARISSEDSSASLRIPPLALRNGLRLFDVRPVDQQTRDLISAPPGATILAGPVEVTPAGYRFEQPARLELALHESASPSARAGIYRFDAADAQWIALPAQVSAPANDKMPAKLSARIDALPEGRAIYAVLSNMKSVKPILLEPPADSRRVALCVVADPGNLVTLGTIEATADARTATTTAAGLAIFPNVYLNDGPNAFTAKARDALGAESEPGVFTVTFDPARAPISYPQTVTLRQDGQQILIDGRTSANGSARNAVILRSESDPKGFLVDLVPGDGPDHVSGYAKLSWASDAGQAVLVVKRVAEKIEAAGPAGALASLQVVDSTPPPEPSVVSLTHPVWANTVPSIAGGLEPGSQSTAQLLGDEPVDLRKFPVLNFRYRIDAAATVQMAVRVNNVDWGFSLAGVPFEAWARGTDPEVQSGTHSFRGARRWGLTADGQWHWASLDLCRAIRALDPASPDVIASNVVFGRWEQKGWNEASAIAQNDLYVGYQIEHPRFLSATGGKHVAMQWDDPPALSGIADYNYVLDQSPDTQPPEEGKGKLNHVELDLPPGQALYYFHLRAKNGAGAWGKTAHYPLIGDSIGPKASNPTPQADSRSADTTIGLTVSDGPGGSGVDPDSIELRADDVSYTTRNPALSYDPDSERLRFSPWQVRPPLAPWADGEVVRVELVAASDLAGNALQQKLAWSFTVDNRKSGSSATQQITSAGGIEPAWAGDSRQIAYIVETPSRSLWILDADNGQVHQVPVKLSEIATPAWSHDGAWVAVSALSESGRHDIYRVDLDSAQARPLTDTGNNNTDPVWLPDGMAILFCRDGDLWRMNPDGRGASRIYHDLDGGKVLRPQVSADGTKVIFWHSLYDEEVWLLDLDSGKAHALTQGGHETDPAFGSAPNQFIYVTSDGSSALLSGDLGGGAARELVAGGGWWDRYPRVSPDLRRMVYQSTRNGFWNLWVVQWVSLGDLKVTPEQYRYDSAGNSGLQIAYDARGFTGADLRVLDSNGKALVSMPLDATRMQQPGEVHWNALSDSGQKLADGTYLVQLLARAPGGGEPVQRGATVIFGAPAAIVAMPAVVPPRSLWPWILAAVLLGIGVALLLVAKSRRRKGTPAGS